MPIISKETWEKFTQEEKNMIIQDYKNLTNTPYVTEFTDEERVGAKYQLEWLFGKENLLPQPLTYEDVVMNLFIDKQFYRFNGDGGIFCDDYRVYSNDDYWNPLNCLSQKQAEKLLAINKLLNVAVYLNKNEDGTPWKPDWSDTDTSKWSIELDNRDNKLYPKSFLYSNHSIVYFPSMETTLQAIQILGEDTVRLALTTEY